MTNLLPQENRDAVRREYRKRFWAVAILFLFFAVGVGALCLLPDVASVGTDYFLNKQSVAGKNATTTKQSASNKESMARLQAFRETVGVLDPRKEKKSTPFSEIIRLVIEGRPTTGIVLNSFSFIADSDSGKRLVLSGVASSRENLVAFSKELNSNNIFNDVELPVSNLSKKENIEFSITLSIVGTTTKQK